MSLKLFKKDWTPAESDEWTVHDLLAALFGVLAFFLVTVGLAGAILLQWWGFVCLAATVICVLLMYRIIDPKLRALSKAFEEKQAGYLETLEKDNRWESDHGD